MVLGLRGMQTPCFSARNAVQQLAERRLAHAYGYVLCYDRWL